MDDISDAPSFNRTLAILSVALPLWGFVFRSHRGNFWTRMTCVAGALGITALLSRPSLRRDLPGPLDLVEGAASAAGLYIIFQIGDRMARRIMPSGEQDIQSVYELRNLAPRALIAGSLIGVIGPSEELFWRGLVQASCIRRFGRPRGTLVAAAIYGGAHLSTGNPTLTGAATVAGAYWGTEYAVRRRLAPLLVSHIIWDIWIFLLQPTPTGK